MFRRCIRLMEDETYKATGAAASAIVGNPSVVDATEAAVAAAQAAATAAATAAALSSPSLSASSSSSALRAVSSRCLQSELKPAWPLPLPPPLPGSAKKHTLILDIDETLLHTFNFVNDRKPQKGVPSTVRLDIWLRPHLREFLSEAKELFEVVFWTAGTASYCSSVVSLMESEVLQLPKSFYHPEVMVAEASDATATAGGNSHANFYALSRSQTLVSHSYMKYIPMLGRPLKNCIMIDDNVRSFPLTPRNGIRIDGFYPKTDAIFTHKHAVDLAAKELGKTPEQLSPDIPAEARLLNAIRASEKDTVAAASDTALLDLLPLLRALAAVPYDADVTRELDHWRPADYARCDDFSQTVQLRSPVRRELLGVVTRQRSEEPVPPPKPHNSNFALVEAVKEEVRLYHRNASLEDMSRAKL